MKKNLFGVGAFKRKRSFFWNPDSSENQSHSSDFWNFSRLYGVIRLLLRRGSLRFLSSKVYGLSSHSQSAESSDFTGP